MIERRNLYTAVPKPINYRRFWDMIIVGYDTVKYLQLCVRNQTPGVRLRSALPVLCYLYIVPRKDIIVTQILYILFYSVLLYIILYRTASHISYHVSYRIIYITYIIYHITYRITYHIPSHRIASHRILSYIILYPMSEANLSVSMTTNQRGAISSPDNVSC